MKPTSKSEINKATKRLVQSVLDAAYSELHEYSDFRSLVSNDMDDAQIEKIKELVQAEYVKLTNNIIKKLKP